MHFPEFWLPIYGWYRRTASGITLREELRAATWLILYLAVMTALSLFGSRQFGGLDWIPYGWDMLLVAVLSLLFCFWGVRSGLVEPALAEIAEPELETPVVTA